MVTTIRSGGGVSCSKLLMIGVAMLYGRLATNMNLASLPIVFIASRICSIRSERNEFLFRSASP